jgi:hypothetical protein
MRTREAVLEVMEEVRGVDRAMAERVLASMIEDKQVIATANHVYIAPGWKGILWDA